ncbi:hypothetical protein Glove_382g68 [Diversispora epigaea]|nr:hypothetical protein Glove_382g68 [Diversispora epigaea]
MSRCSDAIICEAIFDKVVRQVHNISITTTDYIAVLDDSAKYGAHCKHSNIECIGNIQELCFQHIYPNQSIYFSFLTCLNSDSSRVGTKRWAKKCIQDECGLDYDPIDKCVNSNLGKELFISSVQKAYRRNVTKSCTIFINGKLRCIRDGIWYNCDGGYSVDDFVYDIKDAYYNNYNNYNNHIN